jgi:hypothetical protein
MLMRVWGPGEQITVGPRFAHTSEGINTQRGNGKKKKDRALSFRLNELGPKGPTDENGRTDGRTTTDLG